MEFGVVTWSAAGRRLVRAMASRSAPAPRNDAPRVECDVSSRRAGSTFGDEVNRDTTSRQLYLAVSSNRRNAVPAGVLSVSLEEA